MTRAGLVRLNDHLGASSPVKRIKSLQVLDSRRKGEVKSKKRKDFGGVRRYGEKYGE